jgi:hypothetical protein
MPIIGTIRALQIQVQKLKVGQRPDSHYDPRGILPVPTLRLTPDGAIGITADGEALIDIHNARHPQTRNNGDNPISIGFLAHYAAMRARFGAHMTDGVAGENIIIDAADFAPTWDDLLAGLRIVSAASSASHPLRLLKIAAPCVEFSGYAAGNGVHGTALQATLQFLHHGRRGFHVSPTNANDTQPLVVHVGDQLVIGE